MRTKLSDLMFNIVIRMTVGKEGAVAVSTDSGRLRRIAEEALVLLDSSNSVDFLPFMRWMGMKGNQKRLMRLRNEMDEISEEMIEQKRRRRRSEGEESSMLDVLLSLQDTDPEGYTDDIIKAMITVHSLSLSLREKLEFCNHRCPWATIL